MPYPDCRKHQKPVTNVHTVARKTARKKICFWRLQKYFMRFSHKLDLKCYTYLESYDREVDYSIFKTFLGGIL